MSHSPGFLGLQPGMRKTDGAGYTLVGEAPLANAVASTTGLKAEPGCRPNPPPPPVSPSQHVGRTSIFSFSGRVLGHPPKARFTCDWVNSRPPTNAFT